MFQVPFQTLARRSRLAPRARSPAIGATMTAGLLVGGGGRPETHYFTRRADVILACSGTGSGCGCNRPRLVHLSISIRVLEGGTMHTSSSNSNSLHNAAFHCTRGCPSFLLCAHPTDPTQCKVTQLSFPRSGLPCSAYEPHNNLERSLANRLRTKTRRYSRKD